MPQLSCLLLVLAAASLLSAARAGSIIYPCTDVTIGNENEIDPKMKSVAFVSEIGEGIVNIPDNITKPGARLVYERIKVCAKDGVAPSVKVIESPPGHRRFSPIEVRSLSSVKTGFTMSVIQYGNMVVPPKPPRY